MSDLSEVNKLVDLTNQYLPTRFGLSFYYPINIKLLKLLSALWIAYYL